MTDTNSTTRFNKNESINLDLLYSKSLPDSFFKSLISFPKTQLKPVVVIPDSSVVVSSQENYWSNEIAELFSNQNKGLLFKKGKDIHSPEEISFTDFYTAMETLIPNTQEYISTKENKLSLEKSLHFLHGELSFLDKTKMYLSGVTDESNKKYYELDLSKLLGVSDDTAVLRGQILKSALHSSDKREFPFENYNLNLVFGSSFAKESFCLEEKILDTHLVLGASSKDYFLDPNGKMFNEMKSTLEKIKGVKFSIYKETFLEKERIPKHQNYQELVISYTTDIFSAKSSDGKLIYGTQKILNQLDKLTYYVSSYLTFNKSSNLVSN